MSPAIRGFVAYRLVSRGYFHLSVLYIFLLHAGHSVMSVAVVLAAYGLAMAALTPLTPKLVARLGAGRALMSGELGKAAGLLLLAFGADSIGLAVLAQLVNALGFALAISADTVVLNQIAEPARARELQASTQSLMFLALLVSGVAGGALYEVSPRWPIVAGAIAALAAAGIAAVLARSTQAPAPVRGAGGAVVKRVAPEEVRWITYYVMTRGYMLGVFIGLMPFLIFSVLGASVFTLTLYLAAYTLAAFVTARYAHQILERAGVARFAAATAVVLLLALVIFARSSSTPVVVLALVLLGAASGCVRPATMAQLTAASQRFRGTPAPGWLLSRMEGLFGICNALVVLCGGAMISHWSFATAMLVLCLSYAVLQTAAELYARRHNVPAGNDEQSLGLSR